jgi:hypothetical protein
MFAIFEITLLIATGLFYWAATNANHGGITDPFLPNSN